MYSPPSRPVIYGPANSPSVISNDDDEKAKRRKIITYVLISLVGLLILIGIYSLYKSAVAPKPPMTVFGGKGGRGKKYGKNMRGGCGCGAASQSM